MNDTSKAFTPDDLIRRSREALPQEWRSRPYNYPKLQHGVCPPQDEDTLNAYMAAYGEMHVMKLRAALQNFPYDHVLGTVEIVDWGCGQGLGSLVCLSALAQRNRGRYHVRRVSLIDPSECALQRAKNNVCEMFSSQIVTHCNYLPQANRTDCIEHLDYEAQNIIHIFSNILDVAAFDLNRLAQMVSTSGRRHFVVCVCPMNVQAKQMDIFADYFAQKNTFSNINSTYFALTSDTHYPYTCKTNCFEVTGTMAMNAAAPQKVQEWFAEPYRNDYDIQLAIDNGIITAAEAKLHEILNKQLSSDDVIFMRPDINGDQPDIAVVRRHKGILLIKIFEEDINQYELVANKEDNKQQENKKSKTATYHLRHKDEKIECISPLDQITEFGDRLINKHIELLYAKVKDNTKNMSMVKKLVVFAKNSQQEVETFFGDRLKKYVTVAGQELLVSEEQQAKLLDTLRMIFHNIEFDDATANSFINILSPKWHAYDEGEEINLTAAQRKVVESRERARQKIRGVAGSG